MSDPYIRPKTRWNLKRNWPLHFMLLPGFILVFIFAYLPMGGLIMSFQDYKPWLGFFDSPWVGWKNFESVFGNRYSVQVIWNTLIISVLKIVGVLVSSFIFSLLLNEVRLMGFKRSIQTLVYLPHFLSWVILAGVLMDILSMDKGLVTKAIGLFGIDPIFFLGQGDWFRFTVVVSHVWKEFGFQTIIFLASLAGINPALYEAAIVDGANRWKQTVHITIPGMLPITIVLFCLSLGSVLNAGMDQIFNLYNPLVYDKGDIIDTYVYRTAIVNVNYGLGTAVGMFKSVVGLVLIVISYRLAYKWAGYRIF